MHEIAPAPFSSLSEKALIVMSKLLDGMTLACCIYNVDFIILLEEHDLYAGEDMIRKKNFMLVYLPYNVQREENTEHS